MSKFDLTDRSELNARLDELRWRLFEDPDNRVYVLADPLLGSPWERPWQSAGDDSSGNEDHVIDLAAFGISRTLSPFFVRIDRSTSHLLDTSFEIAVEEACGLASARTVCGWFASPLPLHSLRVVIGAQMRRRDGGKQWLMRFHDPRIVRHLPRLLGREFAIHGVSDWWSLDDDGGLIRTRGDTASLQGFRVRAENFLALDSIGLVNQAWAQWQQQGAPVPDDAYGRLFSAAACALAHGLSIERVADCTSFMLHRCLIHPAIERHPDVTRWLALAAQGRGSYADAAAAADPGWWNDVATGRWANAHEGDAHDG